jgi:hypothetical protein
MSKIKPNAERKAKMKLALRLHRIVRQVLLALREKNARIGARIAEFEARLGARSQRADKRLNVIVGTACLADASLHANTRTLLRGILEDAVKAPRDRQFFKAKGWL